MIKADFCRKGGKIVGFKVSGHAYYGDPGQDIVCSAVSSACYMAANGIEECAKVKCDALYVDEGEMFLHCENEKASLLLESLHLHLTALAQDYPQYLKIIYTEV